MKVSFSLQSCPHRRRTPGPPWRSRQKEDLKITYPYGVFFFFFCQFLLFLYPYLQSGAELDFLNSFPHALLYCLTLSCQTEKWQARHGSPATGEGKKRTKASRHTGCHENLNTCACNCECVSMYGMHLPTHTQPVFCNCSVFYNIFFLKMIFFFFLKEI